MPNESTRNVIEIFFLETTCQEVLDGLCRSKRIHFDSSYPKDVFIQKYLVRYNNLTENQVSVLYDSIMWGDNRKSVFSLLSEYAKECIEVNNKRVKCSVEKILAWNSVANKISEDLPVCTYLAENRIDNIIDWNPCLEVADEDMNSLFEGELVDLHHHLKGSSLNAEINWLCLMNHFQSREDKFKPQYGFDYIACIKAAAIRLWLYLKIINRESLYSFEQLARLLHSKDILQLKFNANSLNAAVDVVRSISKQGTAPKVLDYALFDPEDKGLYSFLYGERHLIMSVLNGIDENTEGSEWTSSLLYAYILSKLAFRKHIVQSNELPGFANFGHYDENKTLFVKDIKEYDQIVKKVSIASFLEKHQKERFLETRITPECSKDNLSASIRKMDADICFDEWNGNEKRWNYILHFIKKEDRRYKQTDLLPRCDSVRRQVKQQANSIYLLMNSKCETKDRVAGVDAANSEFFCRPEVFAQAFRFLKGKVGRTYHVGEDFYDIIDGLRAIDEAISFCELEIGDRLGHALALGIEVQPYYQKLDYTIHAPLQVLLDNLCWLYVKAENKMSKALKTFVRNKFKEIAGDLFKKNDLFKYDINYSDDRFIYSYYDAWMLRGNNPEIVKIDLPRPAINDWDRFNVMNGSCLRPDTMKLYSLYHFNAELKRRSERRMSIEINREYREDFVSSIERAQNILKEEIRGKGIHIECNPTSNCRIGGLGKYDKHPIYQFHPVRKSAFFRNKKSLSVSINTDDKGVFSTCLEREYVLLYAAYLKKKPSGKRRKKQAIHWLDGIRKDSIRHLFGAFAHNINFE